jgi:MFS family permease
MEKREQTYLQSSRRIAIIALILYAIGILIIGIGAIVFYGSLISILEKIKFYLDPSFRAEVGKVQVALSLFIVYIIFSIIFALYAGLIGRSVVSKMDFGGWRTFIMILGILNFLAILFYALPVFILPGLSQLYAPAVMILISSILILVCVFLLPMQRLMESGILLIVASILAIIAGNITVSILPAYKFLTSTHIHGTAFSGGVISIIAIMTVGVAIIIRQIVFQWPFISHIFTVIGGVIFAVGIAYIYFSYVSELSSIKLPEWPTKPSPEDSTLLTGLYTNYYTFITGGSLTGVAGILGIIAMILVIVFVAQTALGPARVAAPPKPLEMPSKELRYCPKCGAPVKPEDFYCEKCGYKLR